MNKLLSLIFISLLIVSSSCSDKEDGDVEGIILLVNPANPTFYKSQGDPVEFTFNIRSEESIQSMRIYRQSQKELKSERDTVLDVIPNNTAYSGYYGFKYKIPEDGSAFETVNVLGETSVQTRLLYPIGLLKPLEVQLKSSISSTKNGGFDLINRKVIATDTSIATLAFYDKTDTLNNANKNLSGFWVGVNGTTFVRNNDFNFGVATLENIKTSFEGSNSSSQIGNIKNNDIILVKYKVSSDKTTYVAISINSVTDVEGADSDIYNFTLKYAE